MQTVDQMLADIRNLKIQGATNVALSILAFLSDTIDTNPDIFMPDIEEVCRKLVYIRPTEPLSQNALRFLFADNPKDATAVKTKIATYKSLIEKANESIHSHGSDIIKDGNTYLTHCHASTVTKIFLQAHAAGVDMKVIATETRPRMQGRITVRELLDGGVNDVTMIVDSAAASILSDPKRNIAGVLIGADLLSEGGFVNKIGTLAIVLAARSRNIPVYCFSTLLKYDPRPYDPHLIEMRDPQEVWAEAPANLKIYAPAFDFTPYDLGVTVVSEAGMIQGDKVKETALGMYPFIKE